MEDYKSRGAQKYQNKKKNTGNIGHGRNNIYRTKSLRRRVKLYRRYIRHTYRQALNDGIAKGAQENWLPPTSGKGKQYTDFHSFSRWNYRGKIYHMMQYV